MRSREMRTKKGYSVYLLVDQIASGRMDEEESDSGAEGKGEDVVEEKPLGGSNTAVG